MKPPTARDWIAVIAIIGGALAMTIYVTDQFGTPRERSEAARQRRAQEAARSRVKPVTNLIEEEEPFVDPGIEKARKHLENSPFKNKSNRSADGDAQ